MLGARPTVQGRAVDLYYYAFGLLVLVATVVAYYPGLAGPFVLDDHASLARLGDYGGVRDWDTFEAFVFGGTAGPTGRPLALMSFLIDGQNWPTDAAPFKRTNLILHLLNGGLVWLLVVRVLEVLRYDRAAIRWIALASAALWLLHPFLVSTTLYAVQRMAQLATLFMLAGILAWMSGRMMLASEPRRAYWIMSLSLPLFTFLAMISKENGILLPILIGTIEMTVFAAPVASTYGKLDRRWTALFLWLPLIVIALYLGERLFRPNFLEIVPPRDFSILERLMTQPRVVVDYLQNWFVPKLYTTGVFQDHVIKSTGLLSPVTTLLAGIVILTLLVLAVRHRRSHPLMALAVLFFFANHLLESTVVNLELYFEHRNYLAVCLLFTPLLAMLYKRADWRVFALVVIAVSALLVGFTRYSATVWADYDSMVQASAIKAPTSARAQTHYAALLLTAGYHEQGMSVLDTAIERIPGDNPLLLVNRLTAQCNLKTLTPAEVERVAAIVSGLNFDARMLRVYNNFAKAVVIGRCPEIDLRSILPMFTRMLDVPANSDPSAIEYTHIKFLIGYVRLYLGEIDEAMLEFKDSLESRPGASYAMAMAALLATSGLPAQALELSEIALTQLDTANNTTLIGQRANESDIREFQATVRAELAAKQDADRSGAVD